MPRAIIDLVRRRPPLLRGSTPVSQAVALLLESDLPALPVVEDDGRLAGIFGQREFVAALFPGYVGLLGSASFVPSSLDEALETRAACAAEPVERWMLTEHVEARDDSADVQLAEVFLHHRVRIIPIVDADRRVTGIVTRDDFFRALAERFLADT